MRLPRTAATIEFARRRLRHSEPRRSFSDKGIASMWTKITARAAGLLSYLPIPRGRPAVTAAPAHTRAVAPKPAYPGDDTGEPAKKPRRPAPADDPEPAPNPADPDEEQEGDADSDREEIEGEKDKPARAPRARERARCAAILARGIATRNPDMAITLAFATTLDRAAACALLDRVPRVANGADPLAPYAAIRPGTDLAAAPSPHAQRAAHWDRAAALVGIGPTPAARGYVAAAPALDIAAVSRGVRL
jgi:hypothetical protein